MLTRTVLLPVVVLTAACNHPGEVKAYGDADFRVVDSVFIPRVVDGQVIAGDIVLADKPNLCESIRSGFEPSRMKSVTLRVFRVNETGYLAPDEDSYRMLDAKPTVVGSYAYGELGETDLNCTQTLSANDATLVSGSVVIDHLETGDRGFVSGKFTTYRSSPYVETAWARLVEGRFAAQYCVTGTEKFSCR